MCRVNMENFELFKMQFDMYNTLRKYNADFAEFKILNHHIEMFWAHIEKEEIELAKKCLDIVEVNLGSDSSEVINMSLEYHLCHE